MISGPTRSSWGEAESAVVAELARAAVVERSGQRNPRTARVELQGDSALAYVLMLDQEYAAVWLTRKFGKWEVTTVEEIG